MFEKMLVCLDGSEFSEQILPYAIEEALRFDSQVTLLHVVLEPVVVTPGIPGAGGVPVETGNALEQMMKEQNEAGAYLEAVANQFREKGIKTETTLLQGAAGDAIVSYANESDTGLICIAAHSRSGLGRAVFGSVAEYVLRNTHIPVLMIRPRKIEKS